MFSKCLHVNRDHNLVVVNYALEKDLSEEADVASCTKIFKPFVHAKSTAHLQFSYLQELFRLAH